MQKHCMFEHFFKFLNQIGPKGTLIVTLHDEAQRKRIENAGKVQGIGRLKGSSSFSLTLHQGAGLRWHENHIRQPNDKLFNIR